MVDKYKLEVAYHRAEDETKELFKEDFFLSALFALGITGMMICMIASFLWSVGLLNIITVLVLIFAGLVFGNMTRYTIQVGIRNKYSKTLFNKMVNNLDRWN